jgi:chemotaxis protein methyltransferase CheR
MGLLDQLAPSSQANALGDRAFNDLRTFIYGRTGIFFQDGKRYLLESRIGRRVSALGLRDFDAYMGYVQNGGLHRELPLLVNAITINETYFFRNTAQLDVLESDILIDRIQARERDGTRRVRIWSAACSTGDEPYSIALMLRDRIQPRYPSVRFEIVGTDINTEVLETAQSGLFGAYSMKNVPPNYLSRFFRQEGERYRISPDIRRLVTFRHLNLTDRTGMQTMRGFDVIICANVLIYFDAQSKQQVVASLYGSLDPGGYLMVGFSETLYGVTRALQPVRYAKTIAYQKPHLNDMRSRA